MVQINAIKMKTTFYKTGKACQLKIQVKKRTV